MGRMINAASCSGQSMVEFCLILCVFLGCLAAYSSISMWAKQNDQVVYIDGSSSYLGADSSELLLFVHTDWISLIQKSQDGICSLGRNFRREQCGRERHQGGFL